MRFKSWYNQTEFPSKHETPSGPSMTVPDQTMSVAEMIRRHANGLPFEGVKVPIYEGDTDPLNGINPKTLDMVDLQELRDDAIERNKAKLNKAQERKKADAEAKRQADIRKAAEQLLREAPKQENPA